MKTGSYSIVIVGTGTHSAALEYAADKMAQDFVLLLQQFGHKVDAASFAPQGGPAIPLHEGIPMELPVAAPGAKKAPETTEGTGQEEKKTGPVENPALKEAEQKGKEDAASQKEGDLAGAVAQKAEPEKAAEQQV